MYKTWNGKDNMKTVNRYCKEERQLFSKSDTSISSHSPNIGLACFCKLSPSWHIFFLHVKKSNTIIQKRILRHVETVFLRDFFMLMHDFSVSQYYVDNKKQHHFYRQTNRLFLLPLSLQHLFLTDFFYCSACLAGHVAQPGACLPTWWLSYQMVHKDL